MLRSDHDAKFRGIPCCRELKPILAALVLPPAAARCWRRWACCSPLAPAHGPCWPSPAVCRLGLELQRRGDRPARGAAAASAAPAQARTPARPGIVVARRRRAAAPPRSSAAPSPEPYSFGRLRYGRWLASAAASRWPSAGGSRLGRRPAAKRGSGAQVALRAVQDGLTARTLAGRPLARHGAKTPAPAWRCRAGRIRRIALVTDAATCACQASFRAPAFEVVPARPTSRRRR
jgi:hypothetical protein